MSILIRRARVIDPSNRVDEVCDVLIKNKRIAQMGNLKKARADTLLDAAGLLALPGLIDVGAYLREPGYEFKATIASETRAAAASGITTLCCMPEAHSAVATSATVNLVRRQAEETGRCNVLVIGAMTAALEGRKLSEMAALKRAGCVAFSNGLRPFSDTGFLRRVLQYAEGLGALVFLCPLDHALVDEGCAHEGTVASRFGLPGIPLSAETAALGQYLALVEDTGVKAHFCRLSCARSVTLIAQARDAGMQVTADVSAHQLFLSENDVASFNPDCRLLPPARSEADRKALTDALANGDVEIVCSDHQPHDVNAKMAPLPAAAPGISSLETLLPLMLELVTAGAMPLSTAVAAMTSNPARLLGIERGGLAAGAVADMCLVDADEEWVLDKATMLSNGRNTPFAGRKFKGRVRWTLLGGRIVYGD